MAPRIRWPGTMSESLQVGFDTVLEEWREEDRTRDGGPHLPPFGLQHRIRVFYPNPHHFDAQSEELADPDPLTLSNMYNPLHPLVEDEEAVRNAGHVSLAENMFATFYRATRYVEEEEFMQTLDQDPEESLDALIQFPGSSELSFTPYRRKDGSGTIRLRLVVDYAIETTDTGLYEGQSLIFDGPFAAMYTWIQDETRARWTWTPDLAELVYGESRRAVRHRLLLLAQLYEKIDDPALREEEKEKYEVAIQARYDFKPRRWPVYALMFARHKVQHGNIPEEKSFCGICWRTFDDDREAFRYPCGNHFTCEQCLVWTCEVNGAGSDGAKCELDQTPCFQPWEQEYLKYGVMLGVFHQPAHSEYAIWELHERSFSDLDRHLLNSSATTDEGVMMKDLEIHIENPHMVCSLWMDMLQIDLESRYPESASLCPLYLPELPDIVEACCEAIFLMRGIKCRTHEIIALIKSHIESTLIRKLCDPEGLGRANILFGESFCDDNLLGLHNNARPPLNDGDRARLQLYRDGLEPFIDRILNRLFQFIRVRRCRVAAHLPDQELLWEKRYHCHGARLYYNDEVYAQLFASDWAHADPPPHVPFDLGFRGYTMWKDGKLVP